MPQSGVELLAAGRDADVLDAGAGRVLRRHRDRSRSAGPEAAVMAYARAAGLPVPEVHDVDGPDLLLERVGGPTMAASVTRRPWLLRDHARALAQVHAAVHAVPAPAWLDSPLGEGEDLLHLDLHPENVLISPAGPVVIDWSNAARGPAGAGGRSPAGSTASAGST